MRSTFLPAASASWSSVEIRRMRELAEQGASIDIISDQLRRTPSAIRNKAAMHGISLKSKAPAREPIVATST
jgi:hypothetical protein